MRKTLQNLIIASAFALAAPSFAQARGILEHNITTPLSTPIKIDIVYSEDMQHRANNLPESNKLKGLGVTRGARSGFAGNGYYGEQSLEHLAKSLKRKMTNKFKKTGISVSDDAPTTMRITIVDAKNNRPTGNQLSNQPGLSYTSFGLGGATLNAELLDQNGNSLGTMTYSYFETDIDLSAQFSGMWHDANRSFRFFAKKAAKTLAN